MEFFPSREIIIEIGSLHITWYAAFIVSGAILAYTLSIRQFKKWGYKTALFEDFFLTVMPLAIIGARLWFVAFDWQRYLSDPITIFYIWEGGLAIHGGVVVGILYGLYYFKKHCVNGLRVADVIFPNLMIAQAIGRWGNFMNKECHGGIVPESFYDYFPDFIKEGMYINNNYYAPAFLYESVLNLIGFFVITKIIKKWKKRKTGDLAYSYFIWYGVVRFIVEGIRTDSLMLGSIRFAQLFSIFSILFGVLGIMGIYNKLFKNIYPFYKQKPVVIFDVDGTLLDTRELINQSFIHTFKKYKPEYKLSKEELDKFFGPSLKESFAKYFKEEDIEDIILFYREYNHSNHQQYVKVIDGVKPLLEKLKKENYDLAVASNKMSLSVKFGLQQLGLEEYFNTIVCSDDVGVAKPSPDMILRCCENLNRGHDEIVYVGDTLVDIQTCKNIGAFSIAYVYDENNKDELLNANACRVVDNMEDIYDILKEDVEWIDFSI